MNNACPTCGAVYAVTAKDVGRKIKCKKCSTALRVDDSGLIVDTPTASAPPIPAAPVAAAVVEDDDDGAVVIPKNKKGKKSYERAEGGGGVGEMLKKLGGVPTILFCIGTFLIIWFTFMSYIGEASVARAKMSTAMMKLDMANELTRAKGDAEKVKKIMEDYGKRGEEASKDAFETQVDNVRAVRNERFGQLLGFLFLAFGCIGYLRSEQPPIIHYVAGFILASMMLVVFAQTSGCGGKNSMLQLGDSIGGGKGGPILD